MFERRLKIFLAIIFCLAGVMAARAFQLQVTQKKDWEAQAAKSARRLSNLPTARGRLLDRNGKPLAFDAACIDAAVDYRAIILDDRWVVRQAAARMPPRGDALPEGVTRKQLLADEIEHVKTDVQQMWVTLGAVCHKTPEELEEIKQGIHDRVSVLQRTAWYHRYDRVNKTLADTDDGDSWRKWLIGRSGPESDDKREASLDASSVEVGEQTQPHVIVQDVSTEQQVELQKALPHCPGLVLIQSTHRKYDPQASQVAAHVLGHLSPVTSEDQDADPYLGKDDRRQYVPRDVIGRDGLERLAEPLLRGAKGLEAHVLGKPLPELVSAAVPGRDVKTTIDIDLQREIDDAFEKKFSVVDNAGVSEEMGQLHGAAVVIDVPTGEVLALVSHPTYDVNAFDAEYHRLLADEVNKPLMNRATQLALPPGSTCKTVIGSVAVTTGVLSPTEGIECNGYLKIPDPRDPARERTFQKYRCWTVRLKDPQPHHSGYYAHASLYGHRPGDLSLEDGIERSCNVFFETVAWRMKLPGVIDALDTFGLGRPTGVGIAEAGGTVPRVGATRSPDADGTTFLAGIGQGAVTATPLQMANVAATLARDGVWQRPMLMAGDDVLASREVHPLLKRAFPDDRRDLHLNPEGLAAIRRGMQRVAQSPSGTGPSDRDLPHIQEYFRDIDLAGKTGSAQISATSLIVNVRDGQGNLVHKAEPADLPEKQRPLLKEEYAIGSFPWFRGTGINHDALAHAWFMGYAPAAHPRIAFCVLVEYGGSGGRVCGPIAKSLLEACQNHGYLAKTSPQKPVPVELLREQ